MKDVRCFGGMADSSVICPGCYDLTSVDDALPPQPLSKVKPNPAVAPWSSGASPPAVAITI